MYQTSFKILFIYLLMRDTEREREAETQEEGEAGSMQGAQRGTWSRISTITPWADGQPLSHPGAPMITIYILFLIYLFI